jgi:hypothetical protein
MGGGRGRWDEAKCTVWDRRPWQLPAVSHFPEGSNKGGKPKPAKQAGSRSASSLAAGSGRASFGGRGQWAGQCTIWPVPFDPERGPPKTQAT